METGSYALLVTLPTAVRITVGKLGGLDLPAGCYVYFGSALNGLQARVARHLRSEKKLHWRIDYLTTAGASIEAWQLTDGRCWECGWSSQATNHRAAIAPAPGFGSSDCRCRTHLFVLESLAGARDLLAGLRPPPKPVQN